MKEGTHLQPKEKSTYKIQNSMAIRLDWFDLSFKACNIIRQISKIYITISKNTEDNVYENQVYKYFNPRRAMLHQHLNCSFKYIKV